MWVIRWIFWAFAVLFIIYFAMENAEQIVTVNFYKWRSHEMPLWVVMFISFAAGILTWLVVSIIKILKLQTEVRKVNKENIVMRKELDHLRNIPLDEDSDVIDDIEKEIL